MAIVRPTADGDLLDLDNNLEEQFAFPLGCDLCLKVPSFPLNACRLDSFKSSLPITFRVAVGSLRGSVRSVLLPILSVFYPIRASLLMVRELSPLASKCVAAFPWRVPPTTV